MFSETNIDLDRSCLDLLLVSCQVGACLLQIAMLLSCQVGACLLQIAMLIF